MVRVGTTCTAGFRVSTQKHGKLIRDVRKELDVPNLPVAIGIMGQNGFKEAKGNMAVVQKAQASMNDVPDFRGNVKAIPTDIYWDKRPMRPSPNGGKSGGMGADRFRLSVPLPRQHDHLHASRQALAQTILELRNGSTWPSGLNKPRSSRRPGRRKGRLSQPFSG